MADLASQWFSKHFRGKLSDPTVDSDLILRLLDYAVQFDVIKDEAQARSFFGTHSTSITKHSQAGSLDIKSMLTFLHAFWKGGSVGPQSTQSADGERDLFGSQPVQRKMAARTPVAAPKARKTSPSDDDLLQEAITFGDKFGIFGKKDDLSNFEAFTRAYLTGSKADDPESRPSQIVARFLAEQTDFFRVKP